MLRKRMLKMFKQSGKTVDSQNNIVCLDSNTFIYLTRENKFSWLKRHRLHRKYKKILKKSTQVIVPNKKVAQEAEHYYYVPKSKIIISERTIPKR